MKVAIPTWRDRVSPVFDVAQHLLLLELTDGAEVSRQEIALPETGPVRRARRLQDLQLSQRQLKSIFKHAHLAAGQTGDKVALCIDHIQVGGQAGKFTDLGWR